MSKGKGKSQFVKQVGHHHRIGSTAHGQKNFVVERNELVLRNKSFKLLKEFGVHFYRVNDYCVFFTNFFPASIKSTI